MGSDQQRKPKMRIIRRVVIALVLALVALVLVSAWQATSAYRHLSAASERLPQLREQMISGDRAKLQDTFGAFQDDTVAARRAMDGPNWWLFSQVPRLGPNVEAVQTVTEVVDDLAADAFSDLVEANSIVDPADLRLVNRGIDLAPIQEARPHLVAADRSVAAADARLASVDRQRLVDRVRGPVADLSAQVRDLRSLTRDVADAARLLPPMLGGQGPRHYLVLVQNNAEPRALGGIPGSLILLRADDGRVAIVEQRPAASFGGLGDLGEPVLPLSSAERALFSGRFGRYVAKTTASPDFPRVAQLSQEMWRVATGRRVDGVISIDPVVLQLLLDATGPVTLPNGRRLTGENAAQTLLNQVYIDIPEPPAQDAFFARVTSAIFRQLTTGGVDVRTAGRALTTATQQGRVLLWSSRAKEQAAFSDTAISGELRGKDNASPVVGVYLNDAGSAKLAYYEDMDVEVSPSSCEPDGSRLLDVSVILTSNVPKNVAQLPDYLTGGGRRFPVGNMRSDLLVYAPTDGAITSVRAADGESPATTQTHDGLQVIAQRVTLSPGESVTMTYRIDSRAPLTGATKVRTTPGPTPDRFTVSVGQCPDE